MSVAWDYGLEIWVVLSLRIKKSNDFKCTPETDIESFVIQSISFIMPWNETHQKAKIRSPERLEVHEQ